jgi:hypothetical protein
MPKMTERERLAKIEADQHNLAQERERGPADTSSHPEPPSQVRRRRTGLLDTTGTGGA